MNDNIFSSLTRIIIGKPKKYLAFMAMLFLVSGIPGKDVRMDNDPRKLVFADEEEIDFLDKHHKTFGPDDTTLLTLIELKEGKPEDLIPVIDEISNKVKALEEFERVESVTASSILEPYYDDLIISPAFGKDSLIKGEASTKAEDFKIRLGKVLKSSTTGKRLISDDGRFFIIAMEMKEKYKIVDFIGIPSEKAKSIIESEIAKFKGKAELYYGGIPFVRLESIASIERDIILIFPLVSFLIGIFLFFNFRNIFAVFLPFFAIGLSVTVCIGYLGIIQAKLNPITSMFPVLIMVIAIADGVHFLNRYAEELKQKKDSKTALIETGKAMGAAIFLTSITSAIGFISLSFTKMPVLHGFGQVTALGIMIAFLAILVLIPAGLAIGNVKIDSSKAFFKFDLSLIIRFVTRKTNAKIFSALGILLAISCVFAGKNVIVDYFNSQVLYETHPINEGNRKIDKNMTGSLPMEINLESSNEGDFKKTEILKKIELLENKIKEIFQTESVLGLASMAKELNYSMKSLREIPDDDLLMSQLFFLVEGNEDSGITRLVTDEFDQTRIFYTVKDLGAHAVLTKKKLLDAYAEEIFKDTGVNYRMTGMVPMTAVGFSTIVVELVESLLIALLIIIVTIAIVFRSIKYAIASILPNVLPLLIPLAYYGITNQALDLFASVSFVIAIGIAVDDTIHLLARYREEMQKSGIHEIAIQKAVSHSMQAIITTSIILIFGFSFIALSEFPGNVMFAILSCVIILVALIVDLIFTPAMLTVLKPDSIKKDN